VAELIPNEEQARRLVTSLAVFWFAWGVGILGFWKAPPVGAIAIIVGLVFGFRFYFTLYGVWQPESGESPLKMMFVPGFSRSRLRASRHMFDLLRPSWIRKTIRATAWPPAGVAFTLLGLLLADLLIAVVVFPRLPNS